VTTSREARITGDMTPNRFRLPALIAAISMMAAPAAAAETKVLNANALTIAMKEVCLTKATATGNQIGKVPRSGVWQ
jgi:hypothetical protein